LILNPDVMEFLLMLTGKNGNDFRVQEIIANTAQSLADLDLWKKSGATLLGIRKENGFQLNPESKQWIQKGDRLIIMGSDDQIKKALEII
ncbi:MAG: cation:proton antiporter regulatory subunit, partial [Chitinophagaceae bacterium]